MTKTTRLLPLLLAVTLLIAVATPSASASTLWHYGAQSDLASPPGTFRDQPAEFEPGSSGASVEALKPDMVFGWRVTQGRSLRWTFPPGAKRAQLVSGFPNWRAPADLYFGVSYGFGHDWDPDEQANDGGHWTTLLSWRTDNEESGSSGVSLKSDEGRGGAICWARSEIRDWPDGRTDTAEEQVDQRLCSGRIVPERSTRLIYRIKFSTGSDGIVEAWRDGVYQGARCGANVLDDTEHRWKLGPYSSQDFGHVRTLSMDDVQVGTSYADVSSSWPFDLSGLPGLELPPDRRRDQVCSGAGN